MKTKHILSITFFAVIFSFKMNAQKFTHELGLGYFSHVGPFGNMDAIAYQYKPGLMYDNGSTYLSAAAPINLVGIMVSSARSRNYHSLEVPLALEFGLLNPSKRTFKRINSIYFGASTPVLIRYLTDDKEMQDKKYRKPLSYSTLYAGMHITLLRREFGVNVSFGKNNYSDLKLSLRNRIGFGFSYVLR